MGSLFREIDAIDMCLIFGLAIGCALASAVCLVVAFDFDFPPIMYGLLG